MPCLSACFSMCHVYGTKLFMCNSPLISLSTCFSMYHVHRMKPIMYNSPHVYLSACFSMYHVHRTKPFMCNSPLSLCLPVSVYMSHAHGKNPSVCVYNSSLISLPACFSTCHARGTKPSACGTPGRCHAASASPPPRLTRRACACRCPRKQGDGVADRAASRTESISLGGRWESAA